MKKYLPLTLVVLISASSVFLFKFLTSINTIAEIQKEYNLNLSKYKLHEGLTYQQLKELPKKDRPDLAFMQDFEMTMDPKLGYPPIGRRLKAFEEIGARKNAWIDEYAAISNVKWEERGPSNVGGRTRALMFDPTDPTSKKVWAGAIGGGLWYNDDITSAQSKWQSVGDLMANMAISSLAYDPTNPSIFYMATGLGYTSDIQGDGIFKSTNAGATWTHLASTTPNSDFYFVQKIAVTSVGTVIATTRTGIFRSTDGGANWANVKVGGMGDIEISSDQSIYVTQSFGNYDGAIFKSMDDGSTWTDITPAEGRRIEITSAPSNPNVLYAVADGGEGGADVEWFKKSIDAGTTWIDLDIPKYISQDCTFSTDHFTRGQAWFDLILAVHPENENIAIVGGIDLYKTTDGGDTWGGVSYWTGGCDDYVHADQHEIQFRPGFPNEAIFGTDGGVFYSSDVGSSSDPEFDARNNSYNVTTFYSAAAKNEINSNYFLAGAQDNGTQQFTEPGFGPTREATGGDGGYCFIDQDDANFQITSYVFNSYQLSQDGGLSFVNISNDDKGRFINPTEYDDDANILYGAGGVDELSRIEDISTTPSAIKFTTIDIGNMQITTIKQSPYTDNRLFIGTRDYSGDNDEDEDGNLFVVDDANTDAPIVRDITGEYVGTHGRWVSSIDVGATDDQLLATFSNYGVSSVYETMDGGITWIDKNDNLPDIPVRYGLYNPENRNQVLLATELGVWSTNDISATNPAWESTNSGLANVRCDMLKYRSADHMVIIATFGRGLYTSDVFASTTIADFKTDQIVGYVGVPVHFKDASLLSNDDWMWDFGDGNGTSSEQNPSYTYSALGSYDVSLTIDGGASAETKVGYITILPIKTLPYLAADGGNFESNPNDFTSRALFFDKTNINSKVINHWERGVPSNKIKTVNSGDNAWKTDLDADVADEGFNYKSALYTPAFDLSNTDKNYTVKFRKSISTVNCNVPQALQLQYSKDGGTTWTRLGSSFQEYGAVNWYNRGPNTECPINRSLVEDGVGWSASNVAGGTDHTVHNENTEFSLNMLKGDANVSFRFVSFVETGHDEDEYLGDGFMIDDFEVLSSDASADFDADITTAFIGEPVQFNSYSNGVLTYTWEFGDGSATSNDANPIHIYTSEGAYTVSLTITSTAGSDTQTKIITVPSIKGSSYSLANGGNFETNTSDFRVDHIAGTRFELGNSNQAGKDGTASGDNAWVTGLTVAKYENYSESRLLTPMFNFSNLGQYIIEFKAKYQFEDEWDGFIVEYSTDSGANWTKLNPVQEARWYTTISDPESVFGVSVPFFSGNTAGEFATFTTNVSDLMGNSKVIFRFLFLTDAFEFDAGMALDDFILTGPLAGPTTVDFTYTGGTGCDDQVITFTHSSTGSWSSINWDFGANATPATATGLGPFDVSYVGTGKSTVVLTIESPVNGIVVETKSDIISTAANHIPTFVQEAVAGNAGHTNFVASDGDTYQWYMNTEIIEGATEQIYEATKTANYSVEVDVDGCAGRSDISHLIIITATNDQLFGKSMFVYPNPVSETFTLDVSNEYKGHLQIRIFDMKGVLIYRQSDFKDGRDYINEINVANLEHGIYLVELQMDTKLETRKIILR